LYLDWFRVRPGFGMQGHRWNTTLNIFQKLA